MISRTERRARIPCTPRATRGFTLVEVLVVLAVLGLMAGIVLARGPARSPRLETEAAARQVAAALRGARARAIASNAPVDVAIDLAAGSVRVAGMPARALPGGVRLAMRTVVGADGGRVGLIRFAPDGSASGGRIDIGEGGVHVVVGVDWLSGRVSLIDAR